MTEEKSSSPSDNQTEWDRAHQARSQHDPLLECLVIVARQHGRPSTHDALAAGLPLENHLLTPSLFARAARRAGLASKIVRRKLEQIDDTFLPVVLLLEGRQACLLMGWDEKRENARVVMPDLGEAGIEMPLQELAARYTGSAILVRPKFHFDLRAPEVGKVKRRHWFWGAMAENIPIYRDVLFAAALINIFALALPLFTMNVYDRIVPNQAMETLWLLALGMVLVLFADLMLRTMRGYFIDQASSRIDIDLSSRIMERVLGIRLENRPVSAGSFASNLRSFETVRDFIASSTVTALIDVPFALLFLIVIAWIDWPMLFPGIIGMGLVITYSLMVQGKMHDLAETTYRAGAMRNASLVEALVGLETLKALGAEGVMQRKWERSAAFLSRVSTQLRLLAATTINGTMWIQQFTTIALIVIGAYRIGMGELTLGGLIACSMLVSRVMGPLSQIAGLMTNYHNAVTSLASLDKIMAQEVERPEDANFVSRPHFTGEIEFKDVSFNYPADEGNALKNVSFHIRPGEHVALLGRVGSGKTTLQKLILGLYRPSSGAILIDGVDSRQLDPAELRRSIGYVPQDVTLFYGSLRENIVMASPHVDDAALLAAAQISGISDFVDSHPRGFDMVVGERGESLSGGQRQGVAIARGVVNDPPILLLDEPTGSMDFSSEETIKTRIREFAVNKTMLVITHRTSLFDLVDRIIVVDNGKIVADGPKAQVIEALRQGRIERSK
ncbi:MAG: type I secretion system permease/ATPase [Pseudomonadota bacterium]